MHADLPTGIRLRPESQMTTDVLVVGGGAAGARAALEACREGARVTLLTKGRFGAVGITGGGASGSSAAVAKGLPGLGYGDSNLLSDERELQLVLQAGAGVADPHLAEVLIADTARAKKGLTDLGLHFTGGEGLGGRQHGVPILDVLIYALRRSPVIIIEEAAALDLLIHDSRCMGLYALTADGRCTLFRAKATILATGGCGQLFEQNLLPPCVTGDGYALGFRAGAALANMEFGQVFLSTVYPSRNVIPWHAVTLRTPLLNATGGEFLHDYFRSAEEIGEALQQHALHNPFTTRDRLSRHLELAILGEILSGHGSIHDGCLLDLRTSKALSVPFVEWLAYRGIHCSSGPVHVSISHQCSNGGLVVDENALTTVPGLYACGEQAAGPHGADRLGGQMLLATQVFGMRAGKHAARNAQAPWSFPRRGSSRDLEHWTPYAWGVKHSSPSERIQSVKQKLRRMSWRRLLVLRSESGLLRLLSELEGLELELRTCTVADPNDFISLTEVHNLLTVCEMIARAALVREESRGPHYREDFPERNDGRWQRQIEIRRCDDGMVLRTHCIDPDWEEIPQDLGSRAWG